MRYAIFKSVLEHALEGKSQFTLDNVKYIYGSYTKGIYVKLSANFWT